MRRVEAMGPVLVVLSIPLIMRWVPRNRFYGFRTPATFRTDSVWYDANALSGRHLLALGLLMVGLEFVVPVAHRTLVLASVGWIGVPAIFVADWRTANRWDRERRV
jgi:hypothetical protein